MLFRVLRRNSFVGFNITQKYIIATDILKIFLKDILKIYH